MSKNISLRNNEPRETDAKGRTIFEVNGVTWDSARTLSVIYFMACSNPMLVTAHKSDHEWAWLEIDTKFFGWLLGIENADFKRVEPVLREVKRISLEQTVLSGKRSSSQESWDLIPLLGSYSGGGNRLRIEISNDLLRYLRTQGSRATLPFEFTPDLPSVYAHSIYSNLTVHLHGEPSCTNWIPLDIVRRWPGGSRVSKAQADNFLQKVIATAIREINDRSDMEIAWEARLEPPDSPDINLQFTVKRKDPVLMEWEYLRTRSNLFYSR